MADNTSASHMSGTGGADPELEDVIREELRGRLHEDVEVTCYGQGDALDVRVDFPGLTEALSDSLDGRTVQQYSDLSLTVTRR